MLATDELALGAIFMSVISYLWWLQLHAQSEHSLSASESYYNFIGSSSESGMEIISYLSNWVLTA